MAIVADYLVIARSAFLLKLGTTVSPQRNEMSFPVPLPAGTALNGGEPLLQYVMEVPWTPGTPTQVGLIVDVNGIEVHRKLFLETARDVFTQVAVSGAVFNATGNNALRFRPLVPTNDPTQTITFSSVVLWFQREVGVAG